MAKITDNSVVLKPPPGYDQMAVPAKLRWLVALQEKLRLAHNAEAARDIDPKDLAEFDKTKRFTGTLAAFKQRQRDHWEPRMMLVGGQIAELRMLLPMPPEPKPGEPLANRYDRAAVRATIAQHEYDAIDLPTAFEAKEASYGL